MRTEWGFPEYLVIYLWGALESFYDYYISLVRKHFILIYCDFQMSLFGVFRCYLFSSKTNISYPIKSLQIYLIKSFNTFQTAEFDRTLFSCTQQFNNLPKSKYLPDRFINY